jgi:aminopeptidase N
MVGSGTSVAIRLLTGVGTALCLLGASAAPASADFTPGAATLGDPFFPDAGNGGYDVASYALDLEYSPATHKLDAVAVITASATQDLSSFDLDYRGPRITGLTVGGVDAPHSREGQELVIAPAAGIPDGSQFVTRVAYSGRPQNILDPDNSKDGWVETDDGAFVVGEPQGSPTWFPCNDYPTDKASFTFKITVPRGTEAIANGSLVSRKRLGKRVTWSYAAGEPMATYLATATIGQFRISRAKVAGIESVVAVDPREARASRGPLSKMGRILRLWKSLFGPYPFEQTGAIVDFAPDVGYSLETQTRPIYDVAPDDVTVAHELSHQWFGDSVGLERWQDMWLNEGFATWAEWRWIEEKGGSTTAQTFRKLKRTPAAREGFWDPPPAVIPGPEKLFSTPVYVRGGMALEALRQRIGDRDFYATLRSWAAANAYSTATIDEFIATAEARSGKQLDGLFQKYLYEPGKP